jgi:hypothetical protein
VNSRDSLLRRPRSTRRPKGGAGSLQKVDTSTPVASLWKHSPGAGAEALAAGQSMEGAANATEASARTAEASGSAGAAVTGVMAVLAEP